MEIIFDEPINLEQMADLCAVGIERRPPTQRDYSRWHVTNLLESARMIAKGDNRYHEYEGHPSGIMSFGRIWESAMDCYLANYAVCRDGMYVPDVELVRDGVVASLDGIMLLSTVSSGWMVCETKLRFTQNGEIPVSHLQQVRAYCMLAGVTRVCYVSGHVSSTPPTATARLRVIQLTKQSIRETWDMIVNTKRYLESLGITPSS